MERCGGIETIPALDALPLLFDLMVSLESTFVSNSSHTCIPITQVVAAAVVLKPEATGVTTDAEVERSIKQLCASKLSAFKVWGLEAIRENDSAVPNIHTFHIPDCGGMNFLPPSFPFPTPSFPSPTPFCPVP